MCQLLCKDSVRQISDLISSDYYILFYQLLCLLAKNLTHLKKSSKFVSISIIPLFRIKKQILFFFLLTFSCEDQCTPGGQSYCQNGGSCTGGPVNTNPTCSCTAFYNGRTCSQLGKYNSLTRVLYCWFFCELSSPIDNSLVFPLDCPVWSVLKSNVLFFIFMQNCYFTGSEYN